jgi:hypothetical protein
MRAEMKTKRAAIYFGNRPDVGSAIALVQGSVQVSESDFVYVVAEGGKGEVTIGKQVYRPFRTTVSDGNGNFEIDALPPGEYTIVCVSSHTTGGRVRPNVRDAGGRVYAMSVTIRQGETIDVSHDFGVTAY